MKRWRIRPVAHLLNTAVASEVLAGIGTPHLAANCLAALQQVLPVTFCTVYGVSAAGRIETISAASSYGNVAERTAAFYARQRYDRLDPHMAWLAARALPRQPQLWLGHHRGDELKDADYRAACYDNVGIRERTSVLRLLPTGQRMAVNVYRSFTQPEFDAEDFALLEQHAAFLADAVAAHGRSTVAASEARTPSLASATLQLSLREREVIGHLLAGRTAREAAQMLGVKLSTVRTHQYRAFQRLGIRTLKDLLRGGGDRA